MSENPTKSCINTNCKQVNPQLLTEFHMRKDSKDGYRNICKVCDKIRKASWHKINSKRLNKKSEIWRKTHIKQSNAVKYEWRALNVEKVKLSQYIWNLANPGKIRARDARRRAKKLQATPKWLTEEHHKQIENFYLEASRLTKKTEIPHEVDHIVPLQGKYVRGLHVPWNLRVITKLENRKKSNKIII